MRPSACWSSPTRRSAPDPPRRRPRPHRPPIETSVTVERPLTLYLNGQEIVTMMTILDRPEDLALGYLLNQGMLKPRRCGDRRRVRRGPRRRRRAHAERDRFRGEAAQEDADLRLRPGHRLRRPDGGFRPGAAGPDGRAAHLLALPPAAPDQHPADALPRGRRDPWLRAVRARTSRSSTWRMSAATTRWTRSPAGCSANAMRARGQDLLHDGPPDLGDGDQDRAHGHPDPGLALRLHRLGRGAGARGRTSR